MSTDHHTPNSAIPSRSDSGVLRTLVTPIGALVGGHPTRDRDAADILRDADLPQSLAHAITTILRRSRLWRRERADVAFELTAHFRDGLDAGRSADELLRDFGSPRDAAVLIRRAKRRNRPALWRAWATLWAAMGWLLLALIGTYAFLFARYLMLEPTIARNYLAEINAPVLAVPERDRAWPLYRQAYLSLTPLSDGSPASFELPPEGTPPSLKDSLGAWDLPPALLAETRSYIRLNAPVLDLIRQATQRPALGLPASDALDIDIVRHTQTLGLSAPGENGNDRTTPSPNPPLLEVISPEMAPLRVLAKVLAADAHLAALDSDPERAARDLLSMFAIAEHVATRGWLIADLVAMAIDALAFDTIDQMIEEHPTLLSDDQLTRLAHTVATIGRDHPLVRFQGERLMFDDFLQRLYSDDGKGNGVLTRTGLAQLENLYTQGAATLSPAGADSGLNLALGPVASAIVADRAQSRALYTRLLDAVEARTRLPLWLRDSSSLDAQLEAMAHHPIDRYRFVMISTLMPALDNASLQSERLLQRRDATITVLALEMHRRRTGTYPATLSELSPGLLPAVPPDRFTGEPIGYVLTNRAPTLYSRGVDRDDDHGLPPPNGDHQAMQRWVPLATLQQWLADPTLAANCNGDWILWPRPSPAQ